MEERLQKILSAHGIASRRKAEQMILDGRVRVNGNTARLGDKADESEDVVEVDGRALRREPEHVYLMLNKPRGFVTTLHDEKGRRDVSSLIADCPQRVWPAGRLDLNSEGLLLFTNDGAVTNRLTHPSGQVDKTYLAWVENYRPKAEEVLRGPLTLDGYALRPAKVHCRRFEGTSATLEITIGEGRNRQVRRMCEAAGLYVTRLKRIREGEIHLGDLPPGKWRYLTEAETSYLLRL